jgi:hypothetical protein
VPGTGLQLRKAGATAVEQFQPIASRSEFGAAFPRVGTFGNIVEAFPNAFLGVCISEAVFRGMPRLRRGRKFDWLYSCWCEHAHFRELLELLEAPELLPLSDRCAANSNHDERAALVCLLTAACVARGRYCAIGDPIGGYFFLPPWARWQDWAKQEVLRQRRERPGAFELWLDGRLMPSEDGEFGKPEAGSPVPEA